VAIAFWKNTRKEMEQEAAIAPYLKLQLQLYRLSRSSYYEVHEAVKVDVKARYQVRSEVNYATHAYAFC
jgi:hypothetical protein